MNSEAGRERERETLIFHLDFSHFQYNFSFRECVLSVFRWKFHWFVVRNRSRWKPTTTTATTSWRDLQKEKNPENPSRCRLVKILQPFKFSFSVFWNFFVGCFWGINFLLLFSGGSQVLVEMGTGWVWPPTSELVGTAHFPPGYIIWFQSLIFTFTLTFVFKLVI